MRIVLDSPDKQFSGGLPAILELSNNTTWLREPRVLCGLDPHTFVALQDNEAKRTYILNTNFIAMVEIDGVRANG